MEYLKILLEDTSRSSFRNFLALTFTNKAVKELKKRILSILYSLSKTPSSETHIVRTLCDFLNISEKELAFRSDQILKKILLEYGSFDVITIDKFTYRLVRTFYREFKLSYGFEAIIDPKFLFEETILSIIEEFGENEFLSEILLDFSLEKIDNEKDWDIQKELEEFIYILNNETNHIPVKDLKNKSLVELKNDKILLKKELKKSRDKAIELAEEGLEFLISIGLVAEDFKQRLIHIHLKKVRECDFSSLFNSNLESCLNGDKPLYNKALPEDKKALIDNNRINIKENFAEIKSYVGQYLLIKQTLKSWTPRMLLQFMEKRLEEIQSDKEVCLLGTFNKKINHLVNGESAPFIFERLGERYKYYFLDEFQDTSILQWSNLIPLIANSVESENISGLSGRLILVGDPKQSIYRWRGGDMNQFLDLINKKNNPFQVEPQNKILKKNFRSAKEIVNFNNEFFDIVAKKINAIDYQTLYCEKSKNINSKGKGYVRIESIEKGGNEEINKSLYASKTIIILKKLIEKGYCKSEIAILVRKKSQATELANVLTQEGFSIISSEALKVSNSEKVQLIVALLKLTLNPNSSEQHKIILDILWEFNDKEKEEYYEFAISNLKLKTHNFFDQLNQIFDFNINLDKVFSMTLFEAVDYFLVNLSILNIGDVYVSSFMEEVFNFSRDSSSSILSFLRHWENESKNLNITISKSEDSIKLMTIHQAKGLEFPIVILPFLDTLIHPKLNEKIWYPFKNGKLKKIKWGWFNFTKQIQNFGKDAAQFYDSHRLNQKIDAINVLYVALTRAQNALFVITKEVSTAGSSYAHWLKDYVESKGIILNSDNAYTLGKLSDKFQIHKKIKFKNKNPDTYYKLNSQWRKRIITKIDNDEDLKEAKNQGLLLHNLLSEIIIKDKISEVLEKAISDNILHQDLKLSIEKKLLQIVTHPELGKFFDGRDKVLCEKELLAPSGLTFRPDRINISSSGKISLIDYKTGRPKKRDREQILTYSNLFKEMGYKRIENFLIYINNDLQIIKLIDN